MQWVCDWLERPRNARHPRITSSSFGIPISVCWMWEYCACMSTYKRLHACGHYILPYLHSAVYILRSLLNEKRQPQAVLLARFPLVVYEAFDQTDHPFAPPLVWQQWFSSSSPISHLDHLLDYKAVPRLAILQINRAGFKQNLGIFYLFPPSSTE